MHDSGSDHHPKQQRPGNGLLMLAMIAIAIVAIRRQLQLDKDERTWHGAVGVPVPYEFRRPTVERLRKSFWDPGNPRLFTPMAFGVGWSVNVARLVPDQHGADTN